MAITYVGTQANALLNAYPRAVYRMTLGRAGVSALSYATGLLKWRDQVTQVIEGIGRSGFGIVLGTPLPSDADTVAVIEVRAPTNPASGDSVGDLVRAAENASPYSKVTRVERLGPVPGFSDPGAQADRQAGRESEQGRAAQEAATSGPLAELRAIVGRAGWVLGVGVVLALVIVATNVGRAVREAGGSLNWE